MPFDYSPPQRLLAGHHCSAYWRLLLCVAVVAGTLLGCTAETSSVTSPPIAADGSEQPSLTDPVSSAAEKAARSETRDELIQKFSQLEEAGRGEDAAKVLRQMIVRDPRDYEAIFNLALNTAHRGQLAEALDLMQDIPPEAPQIGISSLGMSAQWAQALNRWPDAEHLYRRVLAVNPQVNPARRNLSQLLNRLGRRHEANQLVRELCLAGDVTQGELQSLIIESDAVCTPASTSNAGSDQSFTAIGPGGLARYLWTQSQFQEAAQTMRPWIESGQATAADIAFMGAIAIEAQQDELFQWWLTNVNDEVKQFPEYWSAIGTHQLNTGDFKAAIHCFGIALQLDPSDIRSTRRMVQAFRSLDDPAMTKLWLQRFESLMNTLNASLAIPLGEETDSRKKLELAKQLQNRGHRLEAVIWKWIAAMEQKQPPNVFADLEQERKQLIQQQQSFPTQAECLCNLDLKQFPRHEPAMAKASLNVGKPGQTTPWFQQAKSTVDQPGDLLVTSMPIFKNAASSAGMDHRYRIAVSPQKSVFAIYQTFGGGVAVTDMDLDGWPDLYLCQGAADPPAWAAVESDRLFRNTTSNRILRFCDTTLPAGLSESSYTIGATSGDWNQDGFPDLVVANLGTDRLMINQGDGTYLSYDLQMNDSVNRLTTSVAMADLNNDQLPDIYLLNYLDDPSIAKKPPQGPDGLATEAVNPTSFKTSRDQWCQNDGKGSWKLSEVGKTGSAESTSLGIVIAPFDSASNQVFIANDELANQLWQYDVATATFKDRAVARGCAFNNLGSPTGSMGIAAADYDLSGTCDLLVTNFYRESNNLYMDSGTTFRDLNVRYGIDRLSALLLGFGCQAIDCSNRGIWDLVVLNGHVENLEHLGQPFRQPAQILQFDGQQFQSANVNDGSDYFDQEHLGRALASGDFNRDGKTDLIATDLMEPTALLINETPSNAHWLRLRLVGTHSERDAIGATVQLQFGEQTRTHWAFAGDGYLAKNEAVLHLGLSDATKVDAVQIRWPSGEVQTWSATELTVDQEYLCCEGEPSLFMLSH